MSDSIDAAISEAASVAYPDGPVSDPAPADGQITADTSTRPGVAKPRLSIASRNGRRIKRPNWKSRRLITSCA
jgi:hypothetical protein